MRQVRQALPAKYHKDLLDNFDQDHTMILGEGTKGLIYQSIMLKPPNVQPVFPVRDESESTRTYIKMDKELIKGKKGPVVIFNTELHDPRSLLFANTHQSFVDLVESIKGAFEQVPDLDLIILYDEKKKFHVNRAIKKLEGVKNVHLVESSDPFNI